MTVTFFQSIGNGKKAGTIVMLRQLFLFVPAMIFLPMVFGIKAVWFTQPLVDFIMIVVGVFMMIGELNKMGKEKFKHKILSRCLEFETLEGLNLWKIVSYKWRVRNGKVYIFERIDHYKNSPFSYKLYSCLSFHMLV